MKSDVSGGKTTLKYMTADNFQKKRIYDCNYYQTKYFTEVSINLYLRKSRPTCTIVMYSIRSRQFSFTRIAYTDCSLL